jgi:aryl-alcohol dehydrogenase-like predicted oxidoreductase
MKLILGTASFGPKPYGEGVTEPVPLMEIAKILTCAYKGGIEILEGAESYNCDQMLQDRRFDLIYKVRHPYSIERVLHQTNRLHLMGLLYHHKLDTTAQMPLEHSQVAYRGSSVYAHKQILGSEDIIEVPLNLENREFERTTAKVKLVRSVFGRGKLLEKYSVKECLDFVHDIPNVHGVIVGVNNVRELEEILKHWHREPKYL